MTEIIDLLKSVVGKIGGTMLAFVVVVCAFLGAGVYAFQVWTESATETATTTPSINKSVDINNTGGKDASQTFGAINF
jgi:hypothetical protein